MNKSIKIRRGQKHFLKSAGWDNSSFLALAGDASRRKYHRLASPDGKTCILMDAPPKLCGTSQPFLQVTNYLLELGLSSPKIISADTDNGFILMEDLGDELFANIAPRCSKTEIELYDASIELLAELHKSPVPNFLSTYPPDKQANLAMLSLEWYGQSVIGGAYSADIVDDFIQIIKDLIGNLSGPEVFTHRDFHAENLTWLAERNDVRRVGILDFQDAVRFNPAYDLVSILQDARRDVPPTLRKRCILKYCELLGVSEEQLHQEMAVCGAQRNLRILGVFVRLACRDGKSGYLKLLPRVWGHLQNNLSHPSLIKLADVVRKQLPPPTRQVLDSLRYIDK